MQGKSLVRWILTIYSILLVCNLSMVLPALPADHASSAQQPTVLKDPEQPEPSVEKPIKKKEEQVPPAEDRKRDDEPEDNDVDQWGNDKDMGC